MGVELNDPTALRSGAHVMVVSLTEDGSPLDLTGYTGADLTYYLGTLGSAPPVTLTIGAGIEVLSPATAGRVRITLTPNATNREPGQYRHELWDNEIASPPQNLFWGTLTIRPSLLASVP